MAGWRLAIGAAALLLTAALARRLWPGDPARAGRAALMLATSGAFLAYSGTVMFDALLTVFVVGALRALWSVHAGGGRAAALEAGALIGAGC